MISSLEVSLGLPWDHAAHGPGPFPLGDLPVDRGGMVLGDARALDGVEVPDGGAVAGPAGVVEVGGCRVLGLRWGPGDHSMRHRGERAYGRVYPVTLEERTGEAVLRWAIPPYGTPHPAEDED